MNVRLYLITDVVVSIVDTKLRLLTQTLERNAARMQL